MELWTAFLLGLAGSLHCAGMCGPLLLSLPMGDGGIGRLAVRRLIYHAGRVLTYGLLGVVFGFLGQALGLAGLQRWVSLGAGILILAGLFAWPARVGIRWAARPVGWLKSAFGGLLRQRSGGAQFLLGGLNGLLPCGLVYVACASASATGGWWRGLEYMVVFGLGTLPMLFGLGLAGRYLHGWLQPRLRFFVPVCLAAMAALLILRGLSLGIPYLSPDLAGPNGACCPLPPVGEP